MIKDIILLATNYRAIAMEKAKGASSIECSSRILLVYMSNSEPCKGRERLSMRTSNKTNYKPLAKRKVERKNKRFDQNFRLLFRIM